MTILEPQLNFKEAKAKAKLATDETLNFVIQDCKDAITANPDNVKNGLYADEVHVCVAELRDRELALKGKGEGKQNKLVADTVRLLKIKLEQQRPLLDELHADSLEDHQDYLQELSDAIALLDRNQGQWGI